MLIFFVDTILLLANLTASRSELNSILLDSPLELSALLISLTNLLNPSVFNDSL